MIGPNMLLMGAASLGMRLDPYQAFNFLVEIEGLITGGFREVRGLESSIEVKEYAEGGLNGFMHKLAGETRYPNLVLSKGLTDVDVLWSWYNDVSNGVIKRRNLTILLLDAQRLPVMWWDVRSALPVKWTGPVLSAESSEVATESLELVHKGIVKSAASSALSAARGLVSLIR